MVRMSNPHPEALRVSHDGSGKPMHWSLPKRGADSTHGPVPGRVIVPVAEPRIWPSYVENAPPPPP